MASILWLQLATSTLEAADPTQRWFTVTSDHFYVHYYRNIRHDLWRIAQHVARLAERAHQELTPKLKHTPKHRTHIVLTDDTDDANGSAQIVPFNAMRIFVARPESLSALSDYDDWLYMLLVHEYAHILHIDAIHGLPKWVNAILGKTWAPNQIQPRWFIEGLATYFESAQTSGGRVRSNIFDMYLRAAVLEDRLLGIDTVSSDTRVFPGGSIPYLYGGRFVDYLVRRFGEERLAEISHDYGGQPIPYSINRVAKRAFGKTFTRLYGEFAEHLRRRYAKQVSQLRPFNITTARQITRHGLVVEGVRYSADGQEIVYVASDGLSHPRFVIRNAITAEQTAAYYAYGGRGVTLSPDRATLVHGQSAPWRTFFRYSDLYIRERRSRTLRRLTRGLRARDPDISPDGRKVVFVGNELGCSSLAWLPITGGRPHVLLRGHAGDQIFTPRFSPDGQRIVFSMWRRGERDIYVVEADGRNLRRVTADRALDLDPMFTDDGAIYYSSDRSGIFNVYRQRPGRPLEQVTNVVTGAFSPAVSPDQSSLYFVGFSSTGFDLFRMDLNEQRVRGVVPRANPRPAAPRLPSDRRYFPVSTYSPWSTIYPRRWQAVFGNDLYGSTVGLELDGGDVVGRHVYRVGLNVGTARGNVSYAASYAYDRFWPAIRLDTSRTQARRGGVEIDGLAQTYIETNYGLGVGLGLPLLRIPDHSVTINLGYRGTWFSPNQTPSLVVEPGELSPTLPSSGRLLGVSVGVSYSNVLRYRWSISAEEGRRLTFGVQVNHPDLGSDFRSVRVSWTWSEYLHVPRLDNHAIALRLAGGISQGDPVRRGLFAIGGFPEQNLIQAIVDTAPIGGQYLRGYAPGAFVGEQFYLLNLEYRFPVWDIEKGISSLPIYANFLHFAFFTDLGDAFFGRIRPEKIKVGVGAEAILRWTIFYIQPFNLRIGYARGLMEKGGSRFHIVIGNRF